MSVPRSPFKIRPSRPWGVEGVIRIGRYLGVPVLVVDDHGDNFVTALWPDKVRPGRSHGKDKPFTFNRGEWWRHWDPQIEDAEFEYEPPVFPFTLEPKPEQTDGITRTAREARGLPVG